MKICNCEADGSDQVPTINWSRFEYVTVCRGIDSVEKKRLQLVDKVTQPKEICLKTLLVKYPYHHFTAKWQNNQLQALLDNQPLGHACAIHDSENYSCAHQDQIQTLYFSQVQASIRITISQACAKRHRLGGEHRSQLSHHY